MRIAVLFLLSSYALYLLAANVILRTHLLRGWLSKDETFLKVEYASAWSLYPGQVVVRDLFLRSQDTNVQMSVNIDRASLRIDLWSLTQHLVRFDRVSADGVVYKMRLKQESLEGNEGRIGAFPRIEGFADPPLVTANPQKKDGDKPHPWTIELLDVSANVRDVWIMEYRFLGAATLAGGFHLEPRHELWVTPSVMHAPFEGVLLLGERELIRGGAWKLEVDIEPFDPAVTKGVDVLKHVNFRVHQHGGLVSIAAIGETYFPHSRVSIAEGAGPIGIDVHVDHGSVQEESRVTYLTHRAVMRAAPFELRTDLALAARVDASGPEPRIVAELSTNRARLTPATDITGVRTTIDVSSADLAAPLSISRVAFSVKSAFSPDLRVWQPIAKDAVVFDGGSSSFTTHGEYREGAFDGRIDLTLDKVAMTIGPFSFVSSGTTSTNVVSKDLAKSLAFPGARADLHDIAIRLLNGHARGMWLHARSDDTTLATDGNTQADSDIGVLSGPGEETVKLFTRLASLPDLAADVTHGTQLDAVVHLRVRHHDIAFGVEHARNGVLQGRGGSHKTPGHGPSGAFVFSVGPFDAGLDIRDGQVSVKPFQGGAWLGETLQKR